MFVRLLEVSHGDLPPSQPLHRWHTHIPSCPTKQDAFPKKSKKRLRKMDCTTRRTETVCPPACGWHCMAPLTRQGQAVGALPSPGSSWDLSSVLGWCWAAVSGHAVQVGACRAHRQCNGAGSQLCAGDAHSETCQQRGRKGGCAKWCIPPPPPPQWSCASASRHGSGHRGLPQPPL